MDFSRHDLAPKFTHVYFALDYGAGTIILYKQDPYWRQGTTVSVIGDLNMGCIIFMLFSPFYILYLETLL